MALEPRDFDLPLVGIKQAADQRAVPVDGSGSLTNYVVERAAALRKRNGITGPTFASGSPVRAIAMGDGVLHVLRGDGTGVATGDLGSTVVAPVSNSQERPFDPFSAAESLARESFVSQGSATDGRALAHVAAPLGFYVTCCCVNGGSVGANVGELTFSVYTRDGVLLRRQQKISGLSGPATCHFVLLSEGTTGHMLLVSNLGGTTLSAWRLLVDASGVSIVATVTVITLPSALSAWDATLGAAGELFVAYVNVVPQLIFKKLNTTTLATTFGPVATGGPAGAQAVGIGYGGGRLAIASVDSGTGAQRGTLVTASTLIALGSQVLGSLTSTAVRTVAACVVNGAAGSGVLSAVYLWSDASDSLLVAAAPCTSTHAHCLDGAGAVYGNEVAWLGVRPSARPFAPSSTRCVAFLDFVPQRAPGSAVVTSANPDQSVLEPGFGTAAVEIIAGGTDASPELTNAMRPMAWHHLARSGVPRTEQRLAHAVSTDGATLCCLTALDRAEQRSSEVGGAGVGGSILEALTTRALLVRYRPLPSSWTHSDWPHQTYSPAGGMRLISGAIPHLVAGETVIPAGYLHPPEIAALRRTVTGTSSVWPQASISLRARYVWYDTQGNELVSAWSLPSQLAVPTATANTRLDIYVRNPHPWPSGLDRRPQIEVAYALGNDTDFRRTRLTQTGIPGTLNSVQTDATARTLVFLTADNLGASVVTTNDLPNDPPPNASHIASGRQRWFLVGADDGQVYFSKPALPGVLPEWSLALTLAPSEGTGRPAAAFEFGDRVVVVGATGACYFVGDGPDANGGGAFFSGPYEVASGHGCISAASVCQAPDAVFWRTKHTMVAFDGAKVQVVGRDVQDELDAYAYTLACDYYPDLNTCCWLVADAAGNREILLYDITHQCWLVWATGLTAPTDLSADASGLYLVGGGRICRYDVEGTDTGYDVLSANFPSGLVRTQAARLGALNGFQRVWYVAIKYESHDPSAAMRVRFFRDGKAAGSPTYTKTSLPVGVDTVRFHVPAEFQRCSSFSVEISDAQANGPDTAPAGVSILGVTLEAGMKRGIRGLPAAQKF